MKNTLTRILLLAAAMVLALSLCLAHAEEPAAEETPEVSTIAYLFWQDSDWWPAVTAKEDEYWTPITATVTGEGYYTVGVQGHMPSWFYSGGNSNRGAQKLAVIVRDGSVLFPNYYMQITDIRVNGVSYPCGDVTYGQTGYDSKADDGSYFWDADDAYGLIYDQWQIDNNGSLGGGTWKSTATAQKFDVFDVSVLNNPGSIEIDFFLSAQQDVKPAGGPALRVIGEGPDANTYVATPSNLEIPENATTASIFYWGGGWWPLTDDVLGTSKPVTIRGEGEYTVEAHFLDQGGWTPSANGANKLLLVVADGANGQGTVMDGMYLGISDVRINGTSINIGNAAYGSTGYSDSANGYPIHDENDGYSILFDEWKNANQPGLPWGHETWNGEEGTITVINPDDLTNVSNVEIDFFVTDEQGKLPEPWAPKWTYKWYPNNTMGVAGISLRDKGITDKWYNVVPVDLTTNGIYEIPMVASNMFQIGTASVAVQDGQATVTYKTAHASAGNLVMSNECVKWFGSIEEITDEFCDAPTSEIAFGEAVDVSGLGDVGYLFICNGVTYSQPITNNGVTLPRYLPKDKVWVDYRAQLEALMAPAAEEAAE
nr:hypothetical protein [Clostridia bacterium]